MAKLILKQCKCKKTFNPKETGASETLCAVCNEKVKAEIRKKDSIRKSLNRKDNPSVELEKLAGIEE